MITGDIKQKVDAVWQTFWNKGFTNTSAIFEQITYLLFMKMLDDKQLEKEAIANLIGDLLPYVSRWYVAQSDYRPRCAIQ